MQWFAQETDHTCGPAALRAALAAFGRPVPDEAGLAARLATDDDGTRPWRMRAACPSLGLSGASAAGLGLADLRRALDAGRLPLVLYMLPEEGVDHYAIVRAVTSDHVELCDPWQGARHRLAASRFLEEWCSLERDLDRWALLLTT